MTPTMFSSAGKANPPTNALRLARVAMPTECYPILVVIERWDSRPSDGSNADVGSSPKRLLSPGHEPLSHARLGAR
jgi:hypothetical protein